MRRAPKVFIKRAYVLILAATHAGRLKEVSKPYDDDGHERHLLMERAPKRGERIAERVILHRRENAPPVVHIQKPSRKKIDI